MPLDANLFAQNLDVHFTVQVGSDSAMGPWPIGEAPLAAYAHRAGVATNSGALGGLPAGDWARAPAGACSPGQVLRWNDGAGQLECAQVTAGLSVYDNAASGLTAADVQAAIDELAGELGDGYATPLILLGVDHAGCDGKNNDHYYGTTVFPRPFSEPPVLNFTIDETLNNNGASWIRLRRWQRSRSSYRCNTNSDMTHWAAFSPGEHTIDGKMVIAGTNDNVSNGDTVFFPSLFPDPPVVLLFVDESDDNSGATNVRIINAVSTGGFEVWTDSTAGRLHWIAMEPGEYIHGRYRWLAGTWDDTLGCDPCTRSFPSGGFSAAPGVVLTIHDTDNSGPTWIRHHTITNTEATFRRSNGNGEVTHFLAFEELF